MIKLLDLNYLQQNHTKIHAFGLGFIQLKLNDDSRLHFYVPEVNKTGGDLEIHNHRYSFTSSILSGSLSNSIWNFIPNENGTHIMVDESCSKDRPPSDNPPVRGNILLTSIHHMSAGSTYTMESDTLHMVKTNRAITRLTRHSKNYKSFAQVIYPENNKLVCPFSADLPKKDLWEIVEREIKDAY